MEQENQILLKILEYKPDKPSKKEPESIESCLEELYSED
jgi:hypothetical protein